jgi:hypothetical protein
MDSSNFDIVLAIRFNIDPRAIKLLPVPIGATENEYSSGINANVVATRSLSTISKIISTEDQATIAAIFGERDISLNISPHHFGLCHVTNKNRNFVAKA